MSSAHVRCVKCSGGARACVEYRRDTTREGKPEGTCGTSEALTDFTDESFEILRRHARTVRRSTCAVVVVVVVLHVPVSRSSLSLSLSCYDNFVIIFSALSTSLFPSTVNESAT